MNGVRFHIGQFRQEQTKGAYSAAKAPAAAEIRLAMPGAAPVRLPFEEVCRLYKEQANAEFLRKIQGGGGELSPGRLSKREAEREADEFVELENRAIIGVPETVTAIMEQIQTFVDRIGCHDSVLPQYYRGLREYASEEQKRYGDVTHAVFHEVYGFKALACWQAYPDSYAAQIIGTSIWIHHHGKHERMPFQFASQQDVDKIIRALTRQKEDAVVNLYHTALEVDLYTGERVTLTVKPDVRHDVITLRRFLIGRVTVEELANRERRTIPEEAVPLLRGLSKTHCNLLIVGPPGTGKSTTLKALLAERENHYTGAVIEKHYELAASRDFPEKKLIERVTHEQTFHHAMDQVLRFDVDYAIIGEVRRVEAEGAMLACERLLKGFASTYHTWKPEVVPSQWARLLCSLNPGARFEQEERRVADNIDIILVQTQDTSRRNKRVKNIMELRLDRGTGEISTHEIMRWDPATDSWQYRCGLSEELLGEMRELEPAWTETVLQTLGSLERESPIPEAEGIKVYNPVDASPLSRIHGELQRLTAAFSRLAGHPGESYGGGS
ncbi:ATPase, T2SS/T4P/T4SS family [Paenibacillus filicis]|uniref:ATPase, T2SS/T4P/T4SS family n=1 Tax=Paenibacillus gyeongsangnamensis TaxID=3388067 RepID=A0ABT4QE41_9BACL|nr:ATPase, T2SS/T4P/T4SS family [Paenibacillus filicis]MCZ8515145.1 ATPase, T2SS/T4P/T4SS family [Paenibacillus filicis]